MEALKTTEFVQVNCESHTGRRLQYSKTLSLNCSDRLICMQMHTIKNLILTCKNSFKINLNNILRMN